MSLITFFKRKTKSVLAKNFGLFIYTSETSKVKHLVLPFCVGKGCDVGFGGQKIKTDNCDGIDLALPYANVGKEKVDIACNIIKEEIPVPDNTYDYVYTSHLIEDFADTNDGLKKLIRVLKSDGNLILVFPDQKIYERICAERNQPLNPHHIHPEMGFDFMMNRMNEIDNITYELLFSSNCEIDYNVVLVYKIKKK